MEIDRLIHSSRNEEETNALIDEIDQWKRKIGPLTYHIIQKLHKGCDLNHRYSPISLLYNFTGKSPESQFVEDSIKELNPLEQDTVRKVIDIASFARIQGTQLSIALTPLTVMQLPEEYLNEIDGLKEFNGGRILKRVFARRFAFYPSSL